MLSKIPVIGPALFNQTIVIYLMYLTVPAVWFALMRTRWGLRVRAVGEHPSAADTVGIKVERTRYRALMIAGAIAGVGGGFYTVVSVSSFGKQMTAGAGFIALAAVIFGKWDRSGPRSPRSCSASRRTSRARCRSSGGPRCPASSCSCCRTS